MLRPDYILTDAELTRAELLWSDPEMVSEAAQDLKCLHYRTAHHGQPANRCGALTLAALRHFRETGDPAYAMALAQAMADEVDGNLRSRAVDEIADEDAERRDEFAPRNYGEAA